MARAPRNLVLVLGDQLDPASAAFDGFEPERDAVWMAEVAEEVQGGHVRRLVLFLSAMRHLRDALREQGVTVHYTELTERAAEDRPDFTEALVEDGRRLKPGRLVVMRPGDHRVLQRLRAAAKALRLELEVRPDRHFLCTPEAFDAWADEHRGLRMEDFYRMMRRRHGVLLEADGAPVGGRWNYDAENREPFPAGGPPEVKAPRRTTPDALTREVMALVQKRLASHPGRVDGFDLPVTRDKARALLRDFVKHRLPLFGRYQDAMWAGRAFLFHSRLGAALNLHLLDPRDCIDAAVRAYEAKEAPLASVEGFVRQLLGWREYVRGVYWRHMPGYAELNALGAERDLPPVYWSGETEMACLADAMRSVLEHGYAHHIQRLMVLGLFSLLYGAHPRRFSDWHLSMYCDAVDQVSLPNALGMSQWADGGILATKPYTASGAYIDRMSNYCGGCRYDRRRTVGEGACPFNALYWDFLDRHEARLAGNARMKLQLANLGRKDAGERREIARRAKAVREAAGEGRL